MVWKRTLIHSWQYYTLRKAPDSAGKKKWTGDEWVLTHREKINDVCQSERLKTVNYKSMSLLGSTHNLPQQTVQSETCLTSTSLSVESAKEESKINSLLDWPKELPFRTFCCHFYPVSNAHSSYECALWISQVLTGWAFRATYWLTVFSGSLIFLWL